MVLREVKRGDSEAGIGQGETGQHNAPTGVRPSSKGGPRSASTSKSCVEGGRGMVSVLNFGVFPVRGRRAWWDEKRGVREQARCARASEHEDELPRTVGACWTRPASVETL